LLHLLDDHPIHQTAEPLVHPATSDRNFYDRFFFNGYTREGDLFFAVAFGLYPNRAIADASLSVVRSGRQHSLHASREAAQRTLRAGPISIEIEAPMRRLRITAARNDWGLEADLRFRARTPAVEEPRFTRREGARLLMDVTRMTQFGVWEGWLDAGGERIELVPERVLGSRDRSWGIRPVGERPPGPTPAAPQFFWLWAPLHFEDCCTHFDVNEDAAGARWHQNGMIVPLLAGSDADPLDASGVEAMAGVEHRVAWEPGTRRAARAELALVAGGGTRHTVSLEPILTFPMSGLGYLHPEWSHGTWKGPEAVGGETWKLADCPPLDLRFLHVQQLVRARMDGREGIGALEQLVIGPHAPSGFAGLLDGAK
jgi:hypothetical protein